MTNYRVRLSDGRTEIWNGKMLMQHANNNNLHPKTVSEAIDVLMRVQGGYIKLIVKDN